MIIEKMQTVQLVKPETEETWLRRMSTILATPYNKGEYNYAKVCRLMIECKKKGHLSVFEHLNVTFKCLTNIETYKDITRHRHCSFTIESTAFSNYEHITVITAEPLNDKEAEILESLHKIYCSKKDTKIARDWLLQSAAAIMIMTTNVTELWHILDVRLKSKNENPLTKQLVKIMEDVLIKQYPLFFGRIL